MDNETKLEFLSFLKPTDDPFFARKQALKFIPSSDMGTSLEWLADYIETLGDKQMASAIHRMRKLKKNIVTSEIENHLYSAFDKEGIKQRIRDGSRI